MVSDLTALPFHDGTFDLAYSKYVFEHLDRPVHVLGELRRVLATGAHLLVLFLSRLLYRAGITYERTVSHWDALAGLRVQLIADLEAR